MEGQWMLLLLIPLAFVSEYVDSSLGMGYGTSLTPILLLLGFEPLEIVPAVLLSEFVSGISAAFFHHSLENVHFSVGSKASRIAGVLSSFSILGTIAAVLLAINISKHTLTLIIGIIVTAMGAVILLTLRTTPRFSWGRIVALGTVASFNKGLSGGGYGPLVMGGQMLSGISVKQAVAITSLAEGLTCLVGVVLYMLLHPSTDWTMAPWLMAGAVLSVPLAAHTLKHIPEKLAKGVTACVILVLGALTLVKTIL